MDRNITIREALTELDRAVFWEQLRDYFTRDMFPDDPEELEYFLGEEYREAIEKGHDGPQDRYRYLFFCRQGQDIGFAMPLISDSEEGKCFLMEFGVFPQFRGNGTGMDCARTLLEWTKAEGASCWELNCMGQRRMRFWSRLGFRENGVDEWDVPLMLLRS